MSVTAAAPVAKQSAAEDSIQGIRKFLTFFLGEEEYGIEILKVREIIGVMPITPMPRTPEYICGVINLRGKVIPVVDLRLKFGMPGVEQSEETCIIVVQLHGGEMGSMVDKVSEVLDIAEEDIECTPSFGNDFDTDYILGIGKSKDRVRLLLDIDKVLSTEDIVQIHSAVLENKEKTNQKTSMQAEILKIKRNNCT